ncbi:MAG TPA: DUF4329 domain-containing protein [Bacteroidales bacterium]|nr:DUF4329 domain-containing protein [Bacteroidales bacterium]
MNAGLSALPISSASTPPSSAEYVYDCNGNMIRDVNKGLMDIQYNVLNLPVSIDKTDGERLEYLYDANGIKKRQVYIREKGDAESGTSEETPPSTPSASPTTTDFAGNFVYVNNQPAWVNYADGRIAYNIDGSVFTENYISDHLGNVRVAYTVNTAGTALVTRQVDSYYPFGMNIRELTASLSSSDRPNEYLYNGKMFQDEMGLNWLDYGARFYDQVLGRWHSVDPLAEKYRRWSPYNYCMDNPMRFIDPDGMRVGPGDLFKKIDDAAKDFGKCYNDNSIKGKTEYNTTIYQVVKTDPKTMKTEGYYTYSVPTKGDNASAVRSPSPAGSLDVATAHTHGAEEAGYVNNEFSPKDKENSEYRNLDEYVATPNGSLQKYDYYSKGTTTIATDMPSDPASGSKRLNNIDPNSLPKNEPEQSTLKTNVDTIVKTLSEVFNIFE